jgi:hypothetical protein
MYDYESKLVDSSRTIADILTAEIADNQNKFDEMYEIALRNTYPNSMRAARIITFCVLKHQKLILPHMNTMLDSIEMTKIDGVKRSFLKILIEIPLSMDEDFQGRLADIIFTLAANNKEAIAVRAFSIDILLRIRELFPELNSELIPLLENIMDDSSVGLRSKCKKILKQLKARKTGNA